MVDTNRDRRVDRDSTLVTLVPMAGALAREREWLCADAHQNRLDLLAPKSEVYFRDLLKRGVVRTLLESRVTVDSKHIPRSLTKQDKKDRRQNDREARK